MECSLGRGSISTCPESTSSTFSLFPFPALEITKWESVCFLRSIYTAASRGAYCPHRGPEAPATPGPQFSADLKFLVTRRRPSAGPENCGKRRLGPAVGEGTSSRSCQRAAAGGAPPRPGPGPGRGGLLTDRS